MTRDNMDNQVCFKILFYLTYLTILTTTIDQDVYDSIWGLISPPLGTSKANMPKLSNFDWRSTEKHKRNQGIVGMYLWNG